MSTDAEWCSSKVLSHEHPDSQITCMDTVLTSTKTAAIESTECFVAAIGYSDGVIKCYNLDNLHSEPTQIPNLSQGESPLAHLKFSPDRCGTAAHCWPVCLNSTVGIHWRLVMTELTCKSMRFLMKHQPASTLSRLNSRQLHALGSLQVSF